MLKLQNQPYLNGITGIGEKITGSIRAFFSYQQNINMLNNLVFHVKIIPVENNKRNSSLNGRTVVFTGTLSMSRKEAQEQAEALGAKVSSSVSTNTNYLVFGKDPGSKYKKALGLGIKILTEDQWCKLA